MQIEFLMTYVISILKDATDRCMFKTPKDITGVRLLPGYVTINNLLTV